MTFWDDVSVLNASIGAGVVRVTGPGGYNQVATFYTKTPAVDGLKVVATFYVTPPARSWSGAANGVYSVSVEPGLVRDVAGNIMPGGVVGTFTVATETKPVVSSAPPNTGITMAVPTTFTLTALSSFPYAPADVFTFTIDWKNDGTDVQTITGTTGTTLLHTFTSIGSFFIRVVATEVHGVASGDTLIPVFVGNAGNPQVWSAAPVLPGSRRLAVGLNQGGTLLCLGGLPTKSNKDIVNSLAPGAALFVEVQRLPAPTIGLGAGIDSLNRVIVFGGIEPGATAPNTNGYVYTTGGGGGAAIAQKTFAVHDFAFATDNLHRIYSISGATAAGTPPGMGVERYDASTNSWTTLAPLPEARVSATATYDGHGHIVVIGGTESVSGALTSTVYSYDIAANSWSQLSGVPNGPNSGRVAALGADGLVYLIGGVGSSAVLVLDSVADAWYAGPSMSTVRGTPAVALGNDGFLYAMGGDNPANGNNGLATTEKIDTGIVLAPQIISAPGFPGTTVPIGTLFSYKVIALGNPRPTFSLVAGPAGMTINPVSGLLTFTPAANQVGTSTVVVRATSAQGIAEQTFTVTVPPPTAPAGISLVFRNATSVTLTWPAATDDVGVVSYNIYGLFRGSRSSHIGLIKSGITNRS